MYTQKDPGDQDEKRHIFSELVYDEFNLPCCWTVGWGAVWGPLLSLNRWPPGRTHRLSSRCSQSCRNPVQTEEHNLQICSSSKKSYLCTNVKAVCDKADNRQLRYCTADTFILQMNSYIYELHVTCMSPGTISGSRLIRPSRGILSTTLVCILMAARLIG